MLCGQGMSRVDAIRQVQLTEQTFYRWCKQYDPDVGVTGNPLRYTSRHWDAETGLYFYRARMYSPTLGRFMQTDPIGYDDGLNMYAYVGNDPFNSAIRVD